MAERRLQPIRPLPLAEAAAIKPREVYESLTIGPDGYPYTHSTYQTIQASPGLTEPVGRLPIVFDQERIVSFQVTLGSTATAVWWRDGSIASAVVQLDPPIKPGRTVELAYETEYAQDDDYPPTSYKRAAGRTALDYLAITIHFSSELTPARLWRAEWDSSEPDGGMKLLDEVNIPLETQGRTLDSGLEIRHVEPGRIVGFHWAWPDEYPTDPDDGEPIPTLVIPMSRTLAA